MKLSRSQVALLVRLARKGWDVAPGGFHGAGAMASAWWRTIDSLKRLGLVERLPDPHGASPAFKLTPAGMVEARAHEPS